MRFFIPRPLSLKWAGARSRTLIAVALTLAALALGPAIALVAISARGARTLETASYQIPLPRGIEGGVDVAMATRVILRGLDAPSGIEGAAITIRSFSGSSDVASGCAANAASDALSDGVELVASAVVAVDREAACSAERRRGAHARSRRVTVAHKGSHYAVECTWDDRDPAGAAACTAITDGLRWR